MKQSLILPSGRFKDFCITEGNFENVICIGDLTLNKCDFQIPLFVTGNLAVSNSDFFFVDVSQKAFCHKITCKNELHVFEVLKLTNSKINRIYSADRTFLNNVEANSLKFKGSQLKLNGRICIKNIYM